MNFDNKAKSWDGDPMKVARAEAVAAGIRSALPLNPTMSGFEYGCGTGLLSFALREDLQQITLADSSSGMLEVLQDKIQAGNHSNMRPMLLDLQVDPLPGERYNLIYSLMTFHHIPDTEEVLRKLHCLLETHGHLCIADLDSEDGSFHNDDFSGHQGFAREALAEKAKRAGFSKVRFSTVFQIEKGNNGERKSYPVFLMIAEKT